MEEEEGKGRGEERRRMQVEEAEGNSICSGRKNSALAKQNTPSVPWGPAWAAPPSWDYSVERVLALPGKSKEMGVKSKTRMPGRRVALHSGL